jgi:hypothetical protein
LPWREGADCRELPRELLPFPHTVREAGPSREPGRGYWWVAAPAVGDVPIPSRLDVILSIECPAGSERVPATHIAALESLPKGSIQGLVLGQSWKYRETTNPLPLLHAEALRDARILLTCARGIRGSDWSFIEGMPRLEVLDVDESCMSDSTLAYVGSLANLQMLVLADTQVTDEGLVHLQGHPTLRTVVPNWLMKETWASAERERPP